MVFACLVHFHGEADSNNMGSLQAATTSKGQSRLLDAMFGKDQLLKLTQTQ